MCQILICTSFGECKWKEKKKHELVANLNEVFSNTGVVVVAHYAGLTVADMTELRSKMRQSGGTLKVAKNRLVKLALQGTKLEHLHDLFVGQTVIAYSDDPVSAPKVASNYAKTNDNFVILGGALGANALDANGVNELASLPSLDGLRAMILGMLQTPATRIAQIVNAPAGQLARVFGAYSKQEQTA